MYLPWEHEVAGCSFSSLFQENYTNVRIHVRRTLVQAFSFFFFFFEKRKMRLPLNTPLIGILIFCTATQKAQLSKLSLHG